MFFNFWWTFETAFEIPPSEHGLLFDYISLKTNIIYKDNDMAKIFRFHWNTVIKWKICMKRCFTPCRSYRNTYILHDFSIIYFIFKGIGSLPRNIFLERGCPGRRSLSYWWDEVDCILVFSKTNIYRHVVLQWMELCGPQKFKDLFQRSRRINLCCT